MLLYQLDVVGFHDLLDDCVLVLLCDFLQVGVVNLYGLLWSVVNELADNA